MIRLRLTASEISSLKAALTDLLVVTDSAGATQSLDFIA